MREQEIAFSALFIMTVFNVILGIFMITGLLPLSFGMVLAVVGMGGISYKAWRMLMNDERPWESPKQYKERTDK